MSNGEIEPLIESSDHWERLRARKYQSAGSIGQANSPWERLAERKASEGDTEEADWLTWRRANPQGSPWEWVMRNKTGIDDEVSQQMGDQIKNLIEGLGDDPKLYQHVTTMTESLGQYGESAFPESEGFGQNFRRRMNEMNKRLIITYLEGVHSFRVAARQQSE